MKGVFMSEADLLNPSAAPIAQHQSRQPGIESKMMPPPRSHMEHYKGAGKLTGRKALITGGDSGIGRAVAIGFAKEGADAAIIYLEEDVDAEETKELVENEGRQCLLYRGDITDEDFCRDVVEEATTELGGLDILVNNA